MFHASRFTLHASPFTLHASPFCSEPCLITPPIYVIVVIMLDQSNGLSSQVTMNQATEFRKLPAVDALLRQPALVLLGAQYGPEQTTAAVRTALAAARSQISSGERAPALEQLLAIIAEQLDETVRATLRPVINATGVIVHTNLGRAPLSQAAIAAIAAVGAGYSNLEYDLAAGERGSRHDHARGLLCALTGAEDALVVNNNAAAVYFVLLALCQGRQVLVSRGELVEIGGGFRIPDVLRQSGAQLVEVGTTNRTHLRDFSEAIGPATGAIMRIHSSNFKQIGFVTMPTLAELGTLTRQHQGLTLIDDLGSGTLLDTRPYGLAAEPMVQERIAAGADLVTFSGDKLLGGPQAGIIVGRAELIARLRRHPMARALRVDKLTFAALNATLQSYARGQATTELPVWQMISKEVSTIQRQLEGWQRRLAGVKITSEIIRGESAVGGGSLPGETLPTLLLAIAHPTPDAIAARLRRQDPPVICRIQHDHLLFDGRTVLPAQEASLLHQLESTLQDVG